jgi:hypothetical protein
MSLGHVRGLLRTETASSAPASPSTGQIYYDTTTEEFKYYDGTAWYDMDTDAGSIPATGLEMWLDANNSSSYPGSGTVWSDKSGNNRDFNVPAAAFNAGSGPGNPAYFNFSSNGYIANNYPTDLPTYSNATVVIFTKCRNTTSGYRTLFRGASNDHQVIIDTGTWDLGYFNNPSSPGFQDSGYNISQEPKLTTNFIMHTYRWANTNDPTFSYWTFNINASTSNKTITSSNATFDNGFCCIGGYHNGSSSTTGGIQQWGDVSAVLYYSRHITYAEQDSIYLYYKDLMGSVI